MKNITFVNAQEMALLHPTTFQAPSQDELDKIVVGDSVKVSVSSERFWTTVTKIDGNNIEAVVDNDLMLTSIHGLKYKDAINFEKKNIYNIL